jgi:hypothetical protein
LQRIAERKVRRLRSHWIIRQPTRLIERVNG